MKPHNNYERLIFTDEPLSARESVQLADHLDQCEACQRLQSGWKASEELLRQHPMAYAAPGFTNRWLTFQQKKMEEKARVANLRIFGSVLGLILALSLFIGLVSYTPGKFIGLILFVVRSVSIIEAFLLQLLNLLNIIKIPLLIIFLFSAGIASGYIGLGLLFARKYLKAEQGVS